MLSNIEELYAAIEKHDVKKVKLLLEDGTNPNECLIEWSALSVSLEQMERGGSIDIIMLLLDFGADVNMQCNDEDLSIFEAISSVCDRELYLRVINLLLERGVDLNIVLESEGAVPLTFIGIDDIITAKLLLKYGAKPQLLDKDGFKIIDALDRSLMFFNIRKIKLFLDNGADASIPDEYGYTMLEGLGAIPEYNALGKKEVEEINNILDPKNPPYLKLGGNKYIIYENKERKPYLLGDINKHKDKNYLYHDFSVSYFLYWCAENGLLIENIKELVVLAKSAWDSVTHQNLLDMMSNSIGHKLTTDFFTEEGKEFAIGYLTITYWWYSYYFDLKKLFSEENSFAVIPDESSSYDLMDKLLSKRFEQFQSGKHFNSNESSAQLQELLGLEVIEKH